MEDHFNALPFVLSICAYICPVFVPTFSILFYLPRLSSIFRYLCCTVFVFTFSLYLCLSLPSLSVCVLCVCVLCVCVLCLCVLCVCVLCVCVLCMCATCICANIWLISVLFFLFAHIVPHLCVHFKSVCVSLNKKYQIPYSWIWGGKMTSWDMSILLMCISHTLFSLF